MGKIFKSDEDYLNEGKIQGITSKNVYWHAKALKKKGISEVSRVEGDRMLRVAGLGPTANLNERSQLLASEFGLSYKKANPVLNPAPMGKHKGRVTY